jgi:hypothetical protein
MTITDAQINAKYESGTNRLVLENDRIKLPKLVENIKYNPEYMMIDEGASLDFTSKAHVARSGWSSAWDEVTKSRLIDAVKKRYSL